MRRRILAALTGVLIGITGGAYAARPAQAAWSDCGNYPGTVCLFAHSNWGTPIWRQFPGQIVGCRPLTGFNDITTVVSNNTAGHYLLTIHEHADCADGWSFDLGSGTYVDFGGSYRNDGASAVSITEL